MSASSSAQGRPDLAETPLTVAVTSGKGGVGKSQLIASLAAVLQNQGNSVLLVDADVGCGNLDLMFDVRPDHDLRAVLRGEKTPQEVLTEAPVGDGTIGILPAPAADKKGAELTPAEILTMVDAVSEVGASYSVVLVDTGAGVSRNPMLFGAAAHRVLVVTTPEPTALRDAYAAIKVLHQAHSINRFELVVNQAQTDRDGKKVYRQLVSVVDQFLTVEVGLIGVLPADDRVSRSVRQRQPCAVAYPTSAYANAVRALAHRLMLQPVPSRPRGQVAFFNEGSPGTGTTQ